MVLSLIALGITQMKISEHKSMLEEISATGGKKKAAEEKLDAQKKETISKLLRQKSRNEDLSVEITEYKTNSHKITDDLESIKLQISEIEKSISDAKTQLAGSGDRKTEASEELRMKLAEVQNLRSDIPKIEQQIENKKFEIREFEDRSMALEEKLSIYSSITAILRQHYLDTSSAIRSYARKRPWIEPGEEITVKLGPIDLSSGYIALPEGAESGLRENMLFAVHVLGEEISQIRIKKAFRTHSLAELVPLVGNPLKLQPSTEVDLVAL